VLTPPLSSSILPGITRDSVIQICQELGITIKERTIQRAALYVADELFFSGTAAEITPIRSVDRITVGRAGAVQSPKRFRSLLRNHQGRAKWLTYVARLKTMAHAYVQLIISPRVTSPQGFQSRKGFQDISWP
jgi:branched-chain amino acid aminotransferase